MEATSARYPQSHFLKRKKKTHDLSMHNICWFDGAAQNNGTLSRDGGIIKTTGNTIYRWTFNCGMGSNTREYLLGVWATLSLSHRLDIDHLQWLGDSKTVDWLNYRCNLHVTSLMGLLSTFLVIGMIT